MSTQPRALRLADWLDKLDVRTPDRIQNCVDAAAELRQLHKMNQELLKALGLMSIDCQHLHHTFKDRHLWSEECPVVTRINALIAKVKEAL